VCVYTFMRRLWCVVELYIYFEMGGGLEHVALRKIEVIKRGKKKRSTHYYYDYYYYCYYYYYYYYDY